MLETFLLDRLHCSTKDFDPQNVTKVGKHRAWNVIKIRVGNRNRCDRFAFNDATLEFCFQGLDLCRVFISSGYLRELAERKALAAINDDLAFDGIIFT